MSDDQELNRLKERIAELEGRLSDQALSARDLLNIANKVRSRQCRQLDLRVYECLRDIMIHHSAKLEDVHSCFDLSRYSRSWQKQVSDKLNALGVSAPRGGKWSSAQVVRATDREFVRRGRKSFKAANAEAKAERARFEMEFEARWKAKAS